MAGRAAISDLRAKPDEQSRYDDKRDVRRQIALRLCDAGYLQNTGQGDNAS
jgi:hypothetical protein